MTTIYVIPYRMSKTPSKVLQISPRKIENVKTVEAKSSPTRSVMENGYDIINDTMVIGEEVLLEDGENICSESTIQDTMDADHNYASATREKNSKPSGPKITYHDIDWRKEYAELRKRVEKSDKAYNQLRRSSEQYKELTKQRMKLYTSVNRCYKKLMKAMSDVFTPDQIEVLEGKSPRGARWSNETVERAARLRSACGKRGYQELLNQQFPYPSERTIRRKMKTDNFIEQPNVEEEKNETDLNNFYIEKENLI